MREGREKIDSKERLWDLKSWGMIPEFVKSTKNTLRYICLNQKRYTFD